MSDDFNDPERDIRGSVDPTSYKREEAEQSSRYCLHCMGGGFATVFDPEYNGSPTITKVHPNGDKRVRAARVAAYCICLLGRWIEANHRKHASDVHKRTPDFADIHKRSSYWLEIDPTEGPLSEGKTDGLPESFRRLLADRMKVHAAKEDTSDHDEINRMFDEEVS